MCKCGCERRGRINGRDELRCMCTWDKVTFSFLCRWWSILVTPGVSVSSHSSCIERVAVLDHTVYS